MPDRRAKFAAYLLSGGFIALPFVAHAEEEAAAPIIVNGDRAGYDARDGSSATKTPTPLIDVPQTVVVITRERLDDQALEQLGDALRYVPGVTLGTGEGQRDQITLRGQSTTADFFVDGLRDDAQYYRPLYNIERVEVLKGANAMIFGRGGGGGVINRVTRQADPARAAAGVRGSVDSFGAWSVAADVNQPLSDIAAARIDTIYEHFANHRDVFDGRFIGVSPAVTVQPGDDTRITASYTYDDDSRVTDRGIPSFAGSPLRGYDRTFFGDEDLNHSRVKAHVARARLQHSFSASLTANLTAQYANYDKYYGNILPAAATATKVDVTGYNSTNGRENWIGQANLVWQGDTGPLRHTLLIGAEAAAQDSSSTRADVLFATAGGGTSLRTTVPLARRLALPAAMFAPISRSSTSDATVLSAYIQDQVELGEHVQLIGGLRYDRFRLTSLNRLTRFAARRTDGVWSPRIGLIVKPQANISLYASYAKSFLPQSGDQFGALDESTAALAPERFRNLEAGVKWDLTPGLSFAAAAFRLDRSNTRAADPANPGLFVLTGATRTKGIEAHLNGQITSRWQASLGYSLQDGQIRSTTTAAPAGRRLAQLPRHQFSAWTRYDLLPSLGLGAGVVHQSRQFTTISNAVALPAFTRVDAAVFWDISPKLGLQLNVENLFDSRYWPAAHTDNNIAPGEPLNARLTLRVKF
ncbi:TonB-dependent receptor [Novosphingobium tardum]|uniref:TonB-dependent receptor n=1 Tax=Novosphingobium tardum TaxID=1538021 RepID=A0ABV8RM83_9SPHN